MSAMKMHKETCLDCGWVQRPIWNESAGDWDCAHCGAEIISDADLAELQRYLLPECQAENDN